MNEFAAPLTALLGTELIIAGLLKASLLLGAAGVAAWLLRGASAAARHGVWCFALLGLLLLPLLSAMLPAWRVAALPSLPAASLSEWPFALPFDAGAPSATHDEAARLVPLAEAAEPAFPASAAWLVLIWGLGAAALLSRLGLDLLRVTLLTRRARPLDDDGWQALNAHLARRLGLRAPVRLLCHPHPALVMTWGVRRPVVLLPAGATTWPEARRRVVLLHELAHHRRRDYLSHLAAHVACALYWFNPLVWAAARRMRAEQERACDDYVLRAGARSHEYAAALLDLARSLRVGFPWQGAALGMARPTALHERIQAILHSQPRGTLTLRAALLTAVLLLGFLLPLAAFQPWRAALPEEDLPAETTVETLLARLNAEPTPSHATIQALGVRRVRRAVYRLMDLLHHPDPALRTTVVGALGEIHCYLAVEGLAAALDDPSEAVRLEAAHAFHTAPTWLDDTLDAKDRQRMQDVLPGALVALHRALDDPSPRVREASAASLAQAVR